MGLTNAARNLMATALVSGAAISPAYNNANSYIGVGDSSTAYANTQTDLVAATNKLKKGMMATFPTDSGAGVLTFKSQFTTGEANFAWQEWGVFNGGAAFATGTMLNRRVESLGTKTSAQTWEITATLTFTAA
jgi:hypothetical protein